MPAAAVVLLAGTDTHADLGRAANAHQGHPDVHGLVEEGFEVITF